MNPKLTLYYSCYLRKGMTSQDNSSANNGAKSDCGNVEELLDIIEKNPVCMFSYYGKIKGKNIQRKGKLYKFIKLLEKLKRAIEHESKDLDLILSDVVLAYMILEKDISDVINEMPNPRSSFQKFVKELIQARNEGNLKDDNIRKQLEAILKAFKIIALAAKK